MSCFWCHIYLASQLLLWKQAFAQIRYSVPEEVKEGTVVGNVAKDLGLDVASLTDRRFRIVSGSKDAFFDVSQDNGALYVHRKIDREELCQGSGQCVMELKVLVENPLEMHYVIVEITDVNDHAPSFPEKTQTFDIGEHALPGRQFELHSAHDPDAGINSIRTYMLTSNDHFEIDIRPNDDDKIPFLVLKKALDREQKYKHSLLVTAVDGGKPPRSGTLNISITVLDTNDNRPTFSQENYQIEIYENISIGNILIRVNAKDPDEGANGEIEGGSENDVTAFLNINSENGKISALKSFDFETLKTFQFRVVATDSGTPSLSSNVTVNVFILDQNDNAPVILYPVSSNGSAEGVEEIPRNVNAGHLVTKVRAYDADIGYNGWLLFSLQEVSDHSLFGLDRYTGQIRTLRSFTETDEAEHKLVVLVKDNGNVSLSATATVVVKLVEPKEAFAASDVKSATKDVEDNNVTFYLMITLGSVSVLFLISIIVLIAMQCSKSTDYTSKYLQETNYDGTLCHSIQYRSGDRRYMLVGPRMSIGSTVVPGSHANTLVLPDRRRTSVEQI
ncbi:protocadherin alpha-8-like [Xenentodon cancila]